MKRTLKGLSTGVLFLLTVAMCIGSWFAIQESNYIICFVIAGIYVVFLFVFSILSYHAYYQGKIAELKNQLSEQQLQSNAAKDELYLVELENEKLKNELNLTQKNASNRQEKLVQQKDRSLKASKKQTRANEINAQISSLLSEQNELSDRLTRLNQSLTLEKEQRKKELIQKLIYILKQVPSTPKQLKNLSQKYPTSYGYDIKLALCDHFPEFKKEYKNSNDLESTIISNIIDEDFEYGMELWKWALYHLPDVISDSDESWQLGDRIFYNWNYEKYDLILNELENDSYFFDILFHRTAYAQDGYVTIIGEAFKQERAEILDKMLECYLHNNNLTGDSLSFYKLLSKVIDLSYEGFTISNRKLLIKYIEEMPDIQQKNKLLKKMSQKWNTLLNESELYVRQKMLENIPPKPNGDPFSLPESVDLVDWYYDARYDNVEITQALYDYFPEINESYKNGKTAFAYDILSDIFEINFSYAITIWRWLLCHFTSILNNKHGVELTESVISSCPYEYMPLLIQEIQKDDYLARIVFGEAQCFYDGCMSVLTSSLNNFTLFKKLFELYIQNKNLSEESYKLEYVLEKILDAVHVNELTPELILYFRRHIDALDKKLKKELLLKKLSKLEEKMNNRINPAPSTVNKLPKKELIPLALPYNESDEFYSHISIAGAQFANEDALHHLQINQDISFEREPENQYDTCAIVIFNCYHERVGYVPRHDNNELSSMMDQGEEFYGIITSANIKYSFPMIEIDIFKVKHENR